MRTLQENTQENTLWGLWVVSKLGLLAHFAPRSIFCLGSISTFWTISSLYVLNYFKYFLVYILQQNVSKSNKKDFELYQVFMHIFLCQNKDFWTISSACLTKCLNTLKLYISDALKALLIKNWFYFFFLMFQDAGMLRYWH